MASQGRAFMAGRGGGRSAVDSFLRNFESRGKLPLESKQEILEVALCYGIFCLAQNFSLKGMTVEELRSVTKYDQVKRRDYYVRNAAKSRVLVQRGEPPAHLKPPHTWRDGDEYRGMQPPAPAAITWRDQAQQESGDFTIDSAPAKPFDEIDYLSELLGKHFVDVAWKTYAGIPQVTTKEKLQELYERVDQRKNRMQFPQVALPVASFVQFLQSYVVSSVSQNQHGIDITDGRHALMDLLDQNSELARTNRTVPPAAARPFERGRSMSADRGDKEDSKIDAARGLSATARLQRTRSYCPPKQSQLPPRSLEHVQSKIQPELQARRDKILRVKKNQTQLMKEQIARARLAEYEAKKDAEVNFTYARKMPLDEITSGAAALEIVDDFIKSPMMDTFGAGDYSGDKKSLHRPTQWKDQLQEELYGTAALSDSFLGSKAPPAKKKPTKTPSSSRGYNGWLGDFGPSHTKTVQPEWATSEDEDADEKDEPKNTRKSKPFEWTFDLPRAETDPRYKENKENRHFTKNAPPAEDDDSFSMYSGSDAFSDTTDPNFRWLRHAV